MIQRWRENEIITLNEPIKEYEAEEEDERDEGENDCDIDMSQMFGGQGQGQRFDLGAMLQMLSMQQGFREERMQQQQQQHPQSDKVIEISGPDIKEMLAVEELDA